MIHKALHRILKIDTETYNEHKTLHRILKIDTETYKDPQNNTQNTKE
jgi:hypothetical protein